MAATLLGQHMVIVQRLVEVGNRHVSGHAPIPHHSTVEKTAVNWDQVLLQEVVTKGNALVNQVEFKLIVIYNAKKVSVT